MAWDDDIDWDVGAPLYPDTPVDYGNPFLPSPLPGDDFGSSGGTGGYGGSEVGSEGPQFDWTSYSSDPTGYLAKLLSGFTSGSGASSSSGGFDIGKLLKGLGLTGGAGGNDSLLPLLSLLLSGGGLINSNNSNDKAVEQLQQGAEKANQLSTDLIGGARGNFAPYIAAGQAAIPQLQGMVGNNNLADKFRSQGPQSNLASKYTTLAQLAKR